MASRRKTTRFALSVLCATLFAALSAYFVYADTALLAALYGCCAGSWVANAMFVSLEPAP